MIGDTAGMIAPLCGDGMSMAMHSAMIAAKLVGEFLENKISSNRFKSDYESKWRKTFSVRLAIGRALQQISLSPGLSTLAIRTCSAVPALSRTLIQATRGKSDVNTISKKHLVSFRL
jgi:flavin-dependent dehydrogenase